MKLRMAWLAIVCLALGAIPALAQSWIYDNGPGGIYPCVLCGNAWTINFGYIASDSFVAGGSQVGAFAFYAWEIEGDAVTSVSWTITGGENSGTMFGAGTASGFNLNDKFISSNHYSYDIDLITVANLDVRVQSGTTYWLNLVNATTKEGEPVYWDENSGVGCGGLNGTKQGCPSLASENETGTIPSESFTIACLGCACGINGPACGTPEPSTPEPSSIMLFGSGILGLIGILRRKLF